MGIRIREAWLWNKGEKRFYKSQCMGSVIHVCSGKSNFGGVQLDLFEKADIKADYRHIPIKDKAFDTVICDPPWGKSERVDKGIKNWLYELRRVSRYRIIIIHNTIFKIKGARLKRVYAVNKSGYFWKIVSVYDVNPTLD